MKRVLIPIDFSEDSLNAMKYGIAMANHLNANVRVMHVKTGLEYAPVFAKNQLEYKLNKEVDSWMQDLQKTFSDDYLVPGGKFDYKIREGNVVNEIANQAKYDDSSLIVVGSHGESGFQSRFIGSNAYRLVAHSPCPILVVNKGMQWEHGVRKVVVPIDFSKASRKKIPIVTGVSKSFNAKVYLVGLRQSKFKFLLDRVNLFMRQVERYMVNNADLTVEKHVLFGKKLVQQIIDYTEEVNGDLVTVHVHHSSNPLSNLFRPFANELINNSSKPVLVIPTKD